MTEEFELALVEMGILEPVRPTEEDRANDLTLEALLGSMRRVEDVEAGAQGEEREAAPDTAALVADSAVVGERNEPLAEERGEDRAAAPETGGEVHDMISLLAAGVDIGDAPASALRNRLRRSFAKRMQQKLAAPAAPVASIQKRSYRKRAQTSA